MKSWLLNELKIKEKPISDIYVNFIIPISSASSNKNNIRFNSWNSFLNGYTFIGERVHKRLIIVWWWNIAQTEHCTIIYVTTRINCRLDWPLIGPYKSPQECTTSINTKSSIVTWKVPSNYQHNHFRFIEIIFKFCVGYSVLLAENNVVKISDFGTCRTWNEISVEMSFIGTYAWMAPEVIRKELCSEKMDVW